MPPSPVHRFSRARARPAVLAAILLALYGTYGLATAGMRGIPTDEPIQRGYGRAVVAWYASGFRVRSAVDEEQSNLYLYGAAVEAPLEALAKVVPADPYLVRHLALVLLTVAGLFGVYALGNRLGGAGLGALALLLLLASPRFVGHSFVNSKDLPFAVFYVGALHQLVVELGRPPGVSLRSLRSLLPLGVLAGLLMGVRVGGGIILVPVLLSYLLKGWSSRLSAKGWMRLGLRFAVVVLVAWAVMLLAWPWAQLSPFGHPLEALRVTGHFPHPDVQLFGGELVHSLRLPISYLPVWLLRTLPEVTLAGLLLLLGVACLRRGRKSLLRPDVFAVVVAGAFPVLWILLTRASLYDGVRHVLFLQPVLAVGAAAGLRVAMSALPRAGRTAAMGMIALGVALPLVETARLLPYEYVYFNRMSGGLKGAAGRYDLDYWGLSYREGAEWMNAHLAGEGEVAVATCSMPVATAHFLAPGIRFLGSYFSGVEGDPDYVLITDPARCKGRTFAGEVVHEVTREGVALLKVYRSPRAPRIPLPGSGVSDASSGRGE